MWRKETKSPRKGGPGITRSDLLIINKIDLAPYVGASLAVSGEGNARAMKKGKSIYIHNLMSLQDLDDVIGWISEDALLEESVNLPLQMNADLKIHASLRNGVTYLKGSYFTPPMKVSDITEDRTSPELRLCSISSQDPR